MAGSASPSTMAAIKVGQLGKCSSLEEQQVLARETLEWMDYYENLHCTKVEDFLPFRDQLNALIQA